MPPEPKAKLKRRSSRRDAEEFRFDGGHAREIEQKRINGQISCAECRRLKIKCDKQIPCQSCQRRGCAALCPNGSLATGQGTRFVLAATEHLHRRITKMSERIRLLEDALGSLQSQHSTEPHPLLREDLLAVTQGDDDYGNLIEDAPGQISLSVIRDNFGTLSITDHGTSRFFGPTGGSECLLMADSEPSAHDSSSSHTTPERMDSQSPSSSNKAMMFSDAFPFTPVGTVAQVRKLVIGQLPPWERALYLSNAYLDRAAWLFRGVYRDQLMDELLPVYYSTNPNKPPPEADISAHDLALLFVVFAVGALVGMEQETANAEAEHYHQIARAAICLQPVFEKPSLTTIQTLHLLSLYTALSGNEGTSKESSMETSWSLLILAAHLSQTIGLHRDCAKWNLPRKVADRRRRLFWDIFVGDAWHAMNTGRPPSFSLAYIDCRFPESTRTNNNEGEVAFDTWCYHFASECVAEVTSRTLTAQTPTYATIMELDRKVREFPIPKPAAAMASSVAGAVSDDMGIYESMGTCTLSHTREVILLHIHRSFFAQAILENPSNPLKGPYAPSFLAVYRASSTILRTIQTQFGLTPELCTHFWTTWTHAFSAAIVFGTIVTRGPRSSLASNAMTELDKACVLFSKAANHSRRAAKALPILRKLCDKAHHALASVQDDQPSGKGQIWGVRVKEEEESDDELAIFAGWTRVVSNKRPTTRPPQEHIEQSLKINETPYAPAQNRVVGPSPSSETYFTEHPSAESSVGIWAQERPAQYTQHRRDYVPVQETSQYPPPRLPYYSHNQQPPQPQHQQPPHPQHAHPHAQSSHSQHSHRQHEQGSILAPSEYTWRPQPNVTQRYNDSPFPVSESHTATYQRPQHYETSSSVAFHNSQPKHHTPTELTELGLVSQESRIDERWASLNFMQDSGYMDGFGYRPR